MQKKWPGLRTDIDCAPGVTPSVVRETAAFNGKLLGTIARERPTLEGAADPRTAFFALLQHRLAKCDISKLRGEFLPVSGPLLGIVLAEIEQAAVSANADTATIERLR